MMLTNHPPCLPVRSRDLSSVWCQIEAKSRLAEHKRSHRVASNEIIRTRWGMLLGLCFLAGCGNSTGPSQQLSASEVNGLVDFLAELVSPAHLPPDEGTPMSCPGGGVLAVGSSSWGHFDGGNTHLNRDGTVSFSNCSGMLDVGSGLTITGALEFSSHQEYDPFGRLNSFAGSYAGSLSWLVDLRSGSCTLNLNILNGDQEAQVTGDACGMTIDRVS